MDTLNGEKKIFLDWYLGDEIRLLYRRKAKSFFLLNITVSVSKVGSGSSSPTIGVKYYQSTNAQTYDIPSHDCFSIWDITWTPCVNITETHAANALKQFSDKTKTSLFLYAVFLSVVIYYFLSYRHTNFKFPTCANSLLSLFPNWTKL